jgi:peptidyl-tRNA hydrolase, PTH1 family
VKLLVGLGNPGRGYAKTRHNVGFRIVEEIAQRCNISMRQENFSSFFGKGKIAGEDVLVIEPQTFMNLSGSAVCGFWNYYDLKGSDVLVVHDDLDLDLGRIKFAWNSGHGGHNGIRSIIEVSGTKEFYRLRVGIGRPVSNIDPADYVLGSFHKSEKETAGEVVAKCADAIVCYYNDGVEAAMQKYHTI